MGCWLPQRKEGRGAKGAEGTASPKKGVKLNMKLNIPELSDLKQVLENIPEQDELEPVSVKHMASGTALPEEGAQNKAATASKKTDEEKVPSVLKRRIEATEAKNLEQEKSAKRRQSKRDTYKALSPPPRLGVKHQASATKSASPSKATAEKLSPDRDHQQPRD